MQLQQKGKEDGFIQDGLVHDAYDASQLHDQYNGDLMEEFNSHFPTEPERYIVDPYLNHDLSIETLTHQMHDQGLYQAIYEQAFADAYKAVIQETYDQAYEQAYKHYSHIYSHLGAPIQ